MPIYEYRCTQCRHKMTIFVRGMSPTPPLACERCGSASVSRLFSTFAVGRSGSEPPGGVDDAAMPDIDESDPRAMARMMRGMSSEAGEDMGPEFEEVVQRMEAGEPIESIDKNLPDAAGGMDDAGSEMGGAFDE